MGRIADHENSADSKKFSRLSSKLHTSRANSRFQGLFKVSYLLKEPSHAILPLVRKRLRQSGLAATPHLKCHWYLDVVPLRASRAEAIRFLTLRWGISLDKVLVVASQQGDDELIRGLTTNVIPFDHDSSLDGLRTQQRVFFSDDQDDVLDGLKHFRFFTSH